MTNKWQIVALTSVAALGVVIYFAEKVPAHAPAKEQVESAILKTDFIAEAKKSVSGAASENLAQLENLAASARNKEQKIQALDSLVKFWDENRKPAASAAAALQLAETSEKAADWYAAADRFFMATRFVKDEKHQKQLFENAISAFEKTLSIEPENLDAKAGLGVCYAESASLTGQAPMKGITLLKEVVAKDSTHINAQLNLGYFSIQSGQFDKALERFELVKKIKPDLMEVYIYIADTYQRMGDNKKAIENLEVYKSKLDDPVLVMEVDRYMNELKNN